MNMNRTGGTEIDRYRYVLPESRIAKYPLPERDRSGLLLYDRGTIRKHAFGELDKLIPAGTRLVFNTTRVIRARLPFQKPTGADIEIFCLEPLAPADYERAFRATGTSAWKCLVGNARKWKGGPVSLTLQNLTLTARLLEGVEGAFSVQFTWEPSGLTFGEILERAGQTPIPPYLKRNAETVDRERYQTVYSRRPGSVAAPTAGLHFTPDLMERLKDKGVHSSELTLHVGTGTFVPVKEKDARNHSMHSELVVAGISFLEQWSGQPGQLLAVGTTSTRSLESLYWLGVKIISGACPDPGSLGIEQWEYEKLPHHYNLEESLGALLGFCHHYRMDELTFSTRLMIVPGYQFRTISGLITNFHMPGSTLLLLIAAFIGEEWRRVYQFALDHQFRFLSYGDSSLLIPRGWSGSEQ